MKLLALLCAAHLLVTTASAQITIPRTVDGNTILLWHLNEDSPRYAFDNTINGNFGDATGTTVVPGRAGSARRFNGTSDYIALSTMGRIAPNFGPAASFTVECWFKTSSSAVMDLISKGLDGLPGYALEINAGKVVGTVGASNRGMPAESLKTITSDRSCHDGEWHHAMLIRDRLMQKIYLYVDGVEAATPVNDAAFAPVTNTQPLTVGRRESNTPPCFFEGTLDEVRITSDARHPQLFTPLMAAWNFDNDSAGLGVLDSSRNLNCGAVTGAQITAGVTGAGRLFNGTSDYILVNDAENGSLDFDTSQSFTVEAWFKTTSSAPMQLLRKGIIPEPGYGLFVSGGYVDAVIGNENGAPSEQLFTLHSDRRYDDGSWHRATLIRDRGVRRIFLYVDSRLVAIPVIDTFPKPIATRMPLTIGRWESAAHPYFYQGALDRISISRGTLHPADSPAPGLLVQRDAIDLGTVVIGDSASHRLFLSNSGSKDTLRVNEIRTTSPVFIASATPLAIGPYDSASITIRYHPTAAGLDSGEVRFTTNDTSQTSVSIGLHGRTLIAPYVTLVSPSGHPTFNREAIQFSWRRPQPTPVKYWFEWSTSSLFTNAVIDSSLTDTMVTKEGFPGSSSIYWRVRAKSMAGWGDFNGFNVFTRGATAVGESGRPPDYALLPNYPNPFNPSTVITFRVPETACVRVEVFDAAGELIRLVTAGVYQPGEYRNPFDGAGLSSGMYFARMRAGSHVFVRPMLFMK